MGTYLSKPITEKISSDGKKDFISYGASSMQGWRIYQEDAHNAILEFDKNKYLFAVYDGHGGHEVAEYTANNLPEYIKNTKNYKDGKFSDALTEAFLHFDETLITPEVLQTLKEIAGTKDEDDSDYDGEEVTHLCREATMPLEELMAKYTEPISEFQTESFKTKEVCSTGECSKVNIEAGPCTSKAKLPSSSSNNGSSNLESSPSCSSSKSICSSSNEEEKEEKEESTKAKVQNNEHLEKLDNESHSNSNLDIKNNSDHSHLNGTIKEENGLPEKLNSTEDNKEENLLVSNTELISQVKSSDDQVKSLDDEIKNSSEVITNADDKGKNPFKRKNLACNSKLEAAKTDKRIIQKRKAIESILKQMQNREPNSEDESDEDEEDEEGCTHFGMNYSDSDSEELDDESEEYEDEGEAEELDEEEKNYNEFAMNMREEPAYDSGCTACVVLIHNSELIVANVGDSRCVVCRDGKALDMSIDHKPEDEEETIRITKAGGKITSDGRVNGGLNLSRALGDHSYKQNKSLKPFEQMISPCPDIRTLELTPEDQFMIVACDGIWNSLNSQEACDYVAQRLKPGVELSSICEELFDHCLAPDVHGDGTGCDNMTCIIIRFEGSSIPLQERKRELSDDLVEETNGPKEKKAKIEQDVV